MGWLKKLTKPISKVLDKIIPNEIKPALPYLSAFAPFMMGPGIVGASGFQGALANPWLRASMAGGLNIGSQLAQEGSEGDFSGISALLAAGTGYGTAAGAPGALSGMKTDVSDFAVDASGNPIQRSFLQKARDTGITGLEKASEFLTGAGETIRDPSAWGMNKETLGAFATPITQGTADLAMADARRALADYNAGLEEGTDAWYDDNARRVAIRSAMEAAGHVEETILDALASLGLRQGGIVGLRNGGRIGFDNGGFSIMDGIKAAYGKGMDKSIPKRKKDEDLTRAEIKRIKMAVFEVLDQTATGGQSAGTGTFIDNLGDALEQFVRPDLSAYINDYMQGTGIFADDFIVGGKEDLLTKAQGGRINKEGGGMMSVLPRGTEMDYRGGGMIPMGSKERADDVPARLSKNEFVMTADAVRAAGGGSVNRGAKRMYNLMHNLEARV